MDPWVESGRVGSRFCRILAGRVGSGQHVGFFIFSLNIYWHHNGIIDMNLRMLHSSFGLIDFLRYNNNWLIQNYSIKDYTYVEGSGRGSSQTFWQESRVGSGQLSAGVGSKKSNPWTTLDCIPSLYSLFPNPRPLPILCQTNVQEIQSIFNFKIHTHQVDLCKHGLIGDRNLI